MMRPRVSLWRERLIRFALGAGSPAVYAVLGVIRNKWLAQHLATAGLGTLAQVLAAMNWLGFATGLGLGLPVTRAVAAARATGDDAAVRRTVRTAFAMVSGAVLAVAAVALAAAPWLSRALLGTPDHAGLLRIALLGVVGLAYSGTVLGLFAGHADVRAPVTVAAAGGGIATVLTFALVPRYGLAGGALAAALLYPCGIVAALMVHRRAYGAVVSPAKPAPVDLAHGRSLLSVGSATLALALFEQGTLLGLRAHYVHAHGVAANGLLQAALALAQQIGAIFYAYLGGYAFGRLSGVVAEAGTGAAALPAASGGADAARAFTRRIWTPMFLLAALLLATAVIGARPLLRLLYSTRFDPAQPLMAWTLLGELGRIGMQVWMLAALPLGGIRLYAPIAASYPVLLAGAYFLFHALGAGGASLPRAYAAAGFASLLLAGVLMSRRGVSLGVRELVAGAAAVALLSALAAVALR